MLTKDDVVYYKTKLKKLLEDAKENKIRFEVINNDTIYFFDDETGEMGTVIIKEKR
jgi:hypothetical protein